jgi:hypothetical protein
MKIIRRKRRKTNKEVAEKLEDNIANGFRMLLGPETTWRSDKQAESMRSIISLKTDQIAFNMLPTGAGKSILFILPAGMRETGTSIIPFAGISLRRGHGMGVYPIKMLQTRGTSSAT